MIIREIPVPRVYRRLIFKWELMRRDPLAWKIAEALVRLADSPWNEDELKSYIKNCIELCDKYQTFIYPAWPVIEAFRMGQVSREEAERRAFIPMSLDEPITFCPSPLLRPYVVVAADTPTDRVTAAAFTQPYPPSDPEPPRLKAEVNLEQVTLWDLERLAKEFKGAVKEAIKNLPNDRRRARAELGFLRTVTEKKFALHLRRYDLHMEHGLSMRLVALLETQERQGKKVPKNPQQRLVGHPVKAESAVADSVKLIYKAIHRRSYDAKRRRLDHPAEGFKPYSCPHHPGNSCDLNCKHLKVWWQRIRPTLPSQKTGIGGVWNPSELDEAIVSKRTDARHNRKPSLIH